MPLPPGAIGALTGMYGAAVGAAVMWRREVKNRGEDREAARDAREQEAWLDYTGSLANRYILPHGESNHLCGEKCRRYGYVRHGEEGHMCTERCYHWMMNGGRHGE
jgi:hypothetical protein